MVDKEKILAGRKVLEDYRKAHAELYAESVLVRVDGDLVRQEPSRDHQPLVEKMLTDLKALGFNSTDKLLRANEQLCYQEVERCYPVVGVCDDCKDRERGCLEHSYTQAQTTPGVFTPVPNNPMDFYYWQHFENHEPPNCSVRREKVAEPEFDVYWEMPTGITLEHYQEMKQRERDGD